MKKFLATVSTGALLLAPMGAWAQTVSSTGGIAQVSPTTAANALGNAFFVTPAFSSNATAGVKAAGADGTTVSLSVGGWYAASPAEASANGLMQPKVDAYGSAFADGEGLKPTYSAAATITLGTAPTDVFQICGVASKVVRIREIILQGSSTVTAGTYQISLIKRSTADTGGTSSAVTQVPNDSASAASGASVLAFTANPTVGTPVGTVRTIYVGFPLLANVLAPVMLEFGAPHGAQAIVLRSAAECLAINLGGVSLLGTTTVAISNVEYTIE